MRAFVFTDESLARHAGRFVWLEIDGEKAENAAVRKKLNIPAYPTLYVLDPASEKVALRWVGGATVPQLLRLLDDGTRSVEARGSGLDAELAQADAMYGAGQDSAAVVAFERVLGHAPADWPHYARAVDALLFSLQQTEGFARCVALSADALERLGRTNSGASAATSGLSCALSLDEKDPQRAERIAFFEPKVLDMVRDRSIPLATDDRSSMYFVLADARDAAKDSLGKRRMLEESAKVLEEAARAARSPEQRAVFDAHRLGVYRELGEPEHAVAMLERSEKDFPKDYNPPARLAMAYLDLKRWDQAISASDRALAKAYGPRKILLYRNRTDILVAKGDSLAARRVLARAIEDGEKLPEDQRPNGMIASLRKRLAAMEGEPAKP